MSGDTSKDRAVDLSGYDVGDFSRGRSLLVEALWIVVDAMFVSSSIPGSVYRRLLLRAFGAKIGRGGTIKPRVKIKFPWRLKIGNDSWIGEAAWIDNLAEVDIGNNCCISQGAYLCTGSHDWKSPRFGLITKPILIGDNAWVAAKATVGPGVTVGAGSVLTIGSVAVSDLEPWTIYQGAPAKAVRTRDLIV